MRREILLIFDVATAADGSYPVVQVLTVAGCSRFRNDELDRVNYFLPLLVDSELDIRVICGYKKSAW